MFVGVEGKDGYRFLDPIIIAACGGTSNQAQAICRQNSFRAIESILPLAPGPGRK